jgi:hypothetical protein
MMKALNKEINWTSDTIKVMLCNGYTPNQDTHVYKSDVTGEVTGTGYVAGGATLTSKTITYNATNNTITLDAADISTDWANSTITATHAVIYDASPATDATRPLLGYVDFGGTQSSSNGNFQITWDAAGIFTITAS